MRVSSLDRTPYRASVAAALLLISVPGHAAGDGIQQLIAVTQTKAAEASNSALGAAERQRQLIAERRARGESVKVDEEQLRALQANAAQVKDLEQRLRQIEAQLKKKNCP